MKKLVDVFLELPTTEGISIIVGAVLFVAIVALFVSRVSFRAGVRYAESRQLSFSTKRRERDAISL
jgi:hypothetical protein